MVEFFRGMPDFPLIPSRTALVILDMQHLMAHPDYGVGRLASEKGLESLRDYYFGEVEAIIPRIELIKSACRKAGIDVLYSHIAAKTTDCRDLLPVLRHYDLLAPKDSKEAHILDTLSPDPGDLVIPRVSLSLFTAPTADQALRNMGIDTLLLTGVMTNVSLETAARDATELDYKVCVVEDACAALTPADHRQGLEIFEWVWTTLATAEEVARRIETARLAALAYG
jgi:ureidoacrylate peracid hydrolase